MAADTREDAAPKPPPSSTSSSNYKKTGPYAVPVVPPNANILSGAAGLNTAGGKTKEPSFVDALKTIKISEIKEVHKKPCVRDSLLTGIGGAFGIGSIRAIWGATVWSSCNWAVGSFVFGSFLMHEYCQRRRLLEKQGIKRAVEIIDRKHSEKTKMAEKARAEGRKAEN